MLLTAVELSGWLWLDAERQTSLINGLRLAFGNLQMPVFFGFFLSTCFRDVRLKRLDLLHLIPLGLGLILALPGNQIPWVSGASSDHHLSLAELSAFSVAAHLLYYGYMLPILGILLTFRRRFRATYSGARSEVLSWLTQLAGASLFAHTLILIREIFRPTANSQTVLTLQMIGALLALGITTWIAVKSLLQPNLFRAVDRRMLNLSGTEHPSLSVEKDRLLTYMDEQEPYLDPDLTLATLSEQIAMTPRDVSELLNQTLGTHFFDFVNQYRVKRAQLLLVSNQARPISDILYAVGFNSKSSFNSAFKKHAGLTPSAYRRKMA